MSGNVSQKSIIIFYMVGQWAAGTIGLNTVCLLGRNLVRDLCKEDKKKFMIKA